ncbi:MAG: hypothetical protein AUJ74_02345 [Candidatus Omnitrophica bacterium CG1_02_44_16]|nr:MAG: hypothetical protein AUJ74_02345 [Candidatus Omnitrophica bacterium CG1_02_44_16]PIY82544.1 MAG: hypothetical protein COY78_06850 [Candidatus Omnitrophica bacterium CG_4_10_14_0_8_um_filter_44_12]PIZ84730.1 MAG: hypothetical protein COX96_02345 [Candidatus Omnitrophica bacterium CG_4_10_14_0_2_um_filter_44_9]
MADKVKINFGQEIVDATPVDINQANEYFNQYFIEDGTVLKMKLVATKVFRIDDRYDQEGSPIYFVQSTNVLSVNSPSNLKKK